MDELFELFNCFKLSALKEILDFFINEDRHTLKIPKFIRDVLQDTFYVSLTDKNLNNNNLNQNFIPLYYTTLRLSHPISLTLTDQCYFLTLKHFFILLYLLDLMMFGEIWLLFFCFQYRLLLIFFPLHFLTSVYGFEMHVKIMNAIKMCEIHGIIGTLPCKSGLFYFFSAAQFFILLFTFLAFIRRVRNSFRTFFF